MFNHKAIPGNVGQPGKYMNIVTPHETVKVQSSDSAIFGVQSLELRSDRPAGRISGREAVAREQRV
jgi:hypothetical protein